VKTRLLLLCALVVLAGVLVVRQVGRARRANPSSAPPNPAAERADAVRSTLDVLRAQCVRAAGGDWDRWVKDLEPFRQAIRRRIAAAGPEKREGRFFESKYPALDAIDDFPLVEPAPDYYLRYLLEPNCLEGFRKGRPVPLVASWLKAQGIDLLFVPVPKMTEVHPEHFAACAEDRVAAPAVRRLMAELLESDVEVVDLLPLFLAVRDQGDPLYQSADPHWSPFGQALGARLIADRLKRYPFIRQAQASAPAWRRVEIPFKPFTEAPAYDALTDRQRERAAQAWPTLKPQILLGEEGKKIFVSAESPVVLIGDSYNNGLSEELGRELNLPVHPLWAAGQTSQPFKEFLRDPDLLKRCKVVVWLVCNTNLMNPWPLPATVSGPGESAVRR
jgi:hypothetical protein